MTTRQAYELERGREANRNAGKREALEVVIAECMRRRDECYRCGESEEKDSAAEGRFFARGEELDNLREDLHRLMKGAPS